jgi:hypothetical protein
MSLLLDFKKFDKIKVLCYLVGVNLFPIKGRSET